MFLYSAGRTIFVESTLGDSWKYVDHGIDSVLLYLFGEMHDPQTVAEKLAVEEFVHKIQLDDDVDQAQRFAEPVANCVHVVSLDMSQEVIEQHFLFLAFFVFSAQTYVQTHDDRSHESAFPSVPYEFRGVAQYGLEKQYETHPLIVGVVFFRVFLAEIIVDTRVSDLDTDLTSERVRHGERGRDPAVRVDRMRRKTTHYTLDRISNKLCSGNN